MRDQNSRGGKCRGGKWRTLQDVENEGPCRIWKMKDHDVSETSCKLSGHQVRLLKAAQQLANRLKSSTIVLGRRTYFITVFQAPDGNSMTLAVSEWVILWVCLLSICSTATLLLTMCSCPCWKVLQRSETRLQACTAIHDAGQFHAHAVRTRCKSRGNTHWCMQLVPSDSNDDNHVEDTQEPSNKPSLKTFLEHRTFMQKMSFQ